MKKAPAEKVKTTMKNVNIYLGSWLLNPRLSQKIFNGSGAGKIYKVFP